MGQANFQAATQDPVISVIVCTRNRAPLLKGLLDSLVRQRLSRDRFEVIVIDNGSSDETQGVCSEFERVDWGFSRHVEPRIGLSNARNRGWRVARGDFLAYVDDDCRVSEDWLQSAVGVMGRVAPDVFGGEYRAFYLDPKPRWFRDDYASSTRGLQPRRLGSQEFVSGGNFFIRRSLLEVYGGFDPSFGMSGSQLGYGEETDLLIRMRADPNSDPVIYYDPDLVVSHLVRPEKMSLRWVARNRFIAARDYRRLLRKNAQLGQSQLPRGLQRLRGLLACAGYLSLLGLQVTWAYTFRDRRRFPYPENYLYERALDRFGSLGRSWAEWRAETTPGVSSTTR